VNRSPIVHEPPPYVSVELSGPEAAPVNLPAVDRSIVSPVRAGGERDVWALTAAAFWTVRLSLAASVCLLGYGLQRLLRTRPEQALRGEWFCRFLVSMGPLAIKVGQVLGAHAHLLPRAMLEKVRELQDNVPAADRRLLAKLLTRSYGAELERVFMSWEEVPVACASIAQVHRAKLRTGQMVALKIVRPGVRRQLRHTLSALWVMAKAAEVCSSFLRQLNLVGHLEELEAILIDQSDMRLEAAHQARVRENFTNHPHVRIPQPFVSLCTRDVLVMEWVDGIRGLESHRVELAPDVLARRLQDAFYTMAYLHGYFHADPHPGNVMFTPAGQIIFLDFGLVGALTELQKWGLSGFYYAAIRKDWPLAIARFSRFFVTNGEAALADTDYCAGIERTLREHFEQRTTQWSTIAFVEDANKVLGTHGLRLNSTFTKVVLAFLSGEGFVTLIDPEIDIWANARKFTDRASPYMSDAVEQRFDRSFREMLPTSLQWRDRAGASLVAPTHLDRYMVPSVYPLFVERARGSRLEDLDGNSFIDLHCGFGAQLLGHAHPILIEAIARAAEAGSVNAIGHRAEVELAEELVAALPSVERVVFANSGTEAVLHALRLCKAARRRTKVAKFEGQYHGFSDQGIVSSWFAFAGPKDRPEPVTGMPGTDQAVAERTLVLQYGHSESLARLAQHADELACVICEPFPSARADCDVAFLRELREVCDRHALPLVFDEVVSGFRVAFGGAQVLAGVQPDLTCLGKIIGGGLPCAAVGGRRELMELAKSSRDPFRDLEQKVFVGGTMSGNSLACSAGLAAVRYLRDNQHIYATLHERTRELGSGLKRVADELGVPYQVSGARSLVTMTFDYRKPKLVREQQAGSNYRANLALAYYMRQHGVYMPELHTMLLCAAHSEQDIEQTVDAFASSLRDMIDDGMFLT
jgi:glutamate-1-semialdehyde 2,1-aminomutase